MITCLLHGILFRVQLRSSNLIISLSIFHHHRLSLKHRYKTLSSSMYLYQNNTTKCNISQLILIVFYLYFMYNLYGDNMNSDNNNNPYVLWTFFIGYYMLYLIFGGLTSFLIGFSILILTILISSFFFYSTSFSNASMNWRTKRII